MPQSVSRIRALRLIPFGICLLALGWAAVANAAGAKSGGVPASLRVVDSKGSTLVEQTQYASPKVKLETDPGATCFGPDDGGSGQRVDVPAPTALSLLVDAGATDPDARPLSVTDAFSFGLGLCGIGTAVSSDTGYWYLKSNHAGSQTGGDATAVAKGDDVLWYLIDDFNSPIPGELVLKAPPTAEAGTDFPVRVIAYADDGTRSPAEGVKVTGAKGPTDADGTTTVRATGGLLTLTATDKGFIPSNEEVVCTAAKLGDCPAGYARTIAGTAGADRIAAGRLAETIVARGGDDRIAGRGVKAPDLIRCGGGDDTVTGYRRAGRNTKFVGCESVR